MIRNNWIMKLDPSVNEIKKEHYDLLKEAWKNMDYSGKLGGALRPLIRNVIPERQR